MDKQTILDITTYILDGMTEEEACVLAGFSYIKLQSLKETSESLRDVLAKAHIQFKHNHIKEIQKNKSEKNSQWLLEKLRPEEFGARAKHVNPESSIQIISAIIRDIQHDNSGITTLTRGARIIEAKDDSNKPLEVSAVLK